MKIEKAKRATGLAFICVCSLKTLVGYAQPEEIDIAPLPHSERRWDDELFQARVQGVYDWIGSGPNHLFRFDYVDQADGNSGFASLPFYHVPTTNRDTATFPFRVLLGGAFESVDVAGVPKDWRDRAALIEYLNNNTSGASEFFKERVEGLQDLQISEQASADTYFLMGNLLFMEGRYEEAVHYYQIAIEEFNDFRLAYRNLAYAHFILGNYAATLHAANAAVDLGAGTSFIRGVQAYSALQENRLHTATQAISIARMLDPENLRWRELQYQIMLDAGQEEQLDRQLALPGIGASSEAAIEGNSLLFRLDALAKQYRQQERDDDLRVILDIKRRAGLASESELSELGLVEATAAMTEELTEANGLIASGNLSSALTIVENVLARFPTSCEGLILGAELNDALQRYEEADRLLRRIELLGQPCFYPTLLRQAQLALNRRDWSHALQLYELAHQQKSISGENISPRDRSLVRHLATLVNSSASEVMQ